MADVAKTVVNVEVQHDSAARTSSVVLTGYTGLSARAQCDWPPSAGANLTKDQALALVSGLRETAATDMALGQLKRDGYGDDLIVEMDI